MKASFKQRLLAYLIDMCIMGFFFFLFYQIFKEGNNILVLKQELNEVNELFMEHQINFKTYFVRYASVIHDLDKERVMYSMMNAFFVLFYFVGVPYFFDGQTIGKKLLKIKIERKDKELLMLNDLMIRSFFVHGLLYLVLSLALIYILPSISYFIITLILGLFQISLVIISAFMVIYRKDKRGLQDIFSKTNVVNER